MRTTVLGAGPAGLYLAILLKKADPRHEVVVFERNPPGATFGWGVVFSEETLGRLRDADEPTYAAITERSLPGRRSTCTSAASVSARTATASAAIRRTALLGILQRRARELGVELCFELEVGATSPSCREADLLVGADGVNSLVRRTHATVFEPRLDDLPDALRVVRHRRTRSTRSPSCSPRPSTAFPGARVSVRRAHEHVHRRVRARTPGGAPGSTTSTRREPRVLRGAVRDAARRPAAAVEPLASGCAFMTVRCKDWSAGATVLLGDAAHTAHFSIGSGTKLAIEDAIELAAAWAP